MTDQPTTQDPEPDTAVNTDEAPEVDADSAIQPEAIADGEAPEVAANHEVAEQTPGEDFEGGVPEPKAEPAPDPDPRVVIHAEMPKGYREPRRTCDICERLGIGYREDSMTTKYGCAWIELTLPLGETSLPEALAFLKVLA